jgi:hypothetical protein
MGVECEGQRGGAGVLGRGRWGGTVLACSETHAGRPGSEQDSDFLADGLPSVLLCFALACASFTAAFWVGPLAPLLQRRSASDRLTEQELPLRVRVQPAAE